MSEKKESFVVSGLLHTDKLMVVQKQQKFIGDKKADGQQDYYYNITLSDGENIITCTSGKIADALIPFREYLFGFDYVDKKLRLVGFKEL